MSEDAGELKVRELLRGAVEAGLIVDGMVQRTDGPVWSAKAQGDAERSPWTKWRVGVVIHHHHIDEGGVLRTEPSGLVHWSDDDRALGALLGALGLARRGVIDSMSPSDGDDDRSEPLDPRLLAALKAQFDELSIVWQGARKAHKEMTR